LTDVHVSTNTISFKTSGSKNTTGFCRITIPSNMIRDSWTNNYTVLLNGTAQSFRNWTDYQNTYIYVSYQQPASSVKVIPELPAVAGLVLLAVTTLIVVTAKKLACTTELK